MLWIIPNFLYGIMIAYLDLPDVVLNPTVRIPLTSESGKVILFIWLTGFAGVLIWKTVEHNIFRRFILNDAVPVTDPNTISVWDRITYETGIKEHKVAIVVSSNIETPLSIGLWWDTIKVVLPERSYTTEELELILLHEVIHISRHDSWQKLFIVFCIAMCWFNPFMWIAMRKNAEDIELSCDETVLINANNELRSKYANLILNIAGDERGFTTCLSASAKSIRNRLIEISKPTKRSSGAFIVALIFFILFITCGLISVELC